MSSATQKKTSVTQIALLCAVAASFAFGCVSSSDNKGGGTGGSPSAGGTAGAVNPGSGGSSSTTGDAGALPLATACAALTKPLITDFTFAGIDAGIVPTQATFGDFTTTWSGGTYIYPDGAAVPAPAFPLTSDITGSNWHITGTVGTYSGLGLYWNACALVNASMYSGISLTISGSIPAPNTLTMSVNTAADTISTDWYAKNTVAPATYSPTFGTCSPKSNQYDGTCKAPSAIIPVTAVATTVTIPWANLTGGLPQGTVAPDKLTGITFFFTWAASGVAPYPVDIKIDDLSFMP
jgi:hypothetical protein